MARGWTKETLRDYEQRSSRDRTTRVCPAVPKPVEGKPLERPLPRKEKSSEGFTQRFSITFVVFSLRPCDWDGYHIKEIQDMLVHAGVLLSDDWTVLEGRVISRKAHSKAEEKTVIEITPI